VFPFDTWHRRRIRPSLVLIFVEAFIVSLVATGMAWLVFSAAAGLIAVFLICVGMQDSFVILLECNRKDIWEERLAPYSANAYLTAALVSIFLGCFIGFSAIAWTLPADVMRTVFGPQMQLSPLEGVNLGNLQFGHFDTLLAHNLGVFALSILISAVFRSGGALLILSWNASVWALSYVHVSRLTILLGEGALLSTAVAVVVGITPHLVIEAAAYVIGTMVGIFTAKAIEKYRLRDPRFGRVIVASVTLVGIGVILLAVGAFIEGRWPGYWIGLFLSDR